jgi:V/A-type H+-transporting ATPase subunit E
MEENVDRITSKILEDAEKKSNEIIGQAEKEAKEKVDSSRRRGEATKDRMISEAKKIADQTKKKTIAESKIKARTILLESKEKLILRAFEMASAQLDKLSDHKSYPGILERMAIDTSILIGGGELSLIVRKEDEKILEKNIKKIEKEVKDATGKPSKISISTDDIGLGVIVKRSSGLVGIDSTLHTRLELLRPELRLKVAEALFL